MDNIANITSARSITASVLNGDTPASNATISAYIKYLCNAYPKVLLARTRNPQYDIEGIQVIDIVKWLLA